MIFVGLFQARELGLEVFHGATTIQDDKVVSNGDRVLTVTAVKKDLMSALEDVYKGLAAISFQGATYRKDVGYQALRFLGQSVYVSKALADDLYLPSNYNFVPYFLNAIILGKKKRLLTF